MARVRVQTLLAVALACGVPAACLAGELASDPAQTWLALAGRSADTNDPIRPTSLGWLAAADPDKPAVPKASTAKINVAELDAAGLRSRMTIGHTIEGVGGGGFVPVAYLINPGKPGEIFGMPSVTARYVWLGHKKSMQGLAITQTLFRRIELGYALIRLDLGNLPDDLSNKVRGAGMRTDDIYLNNFNLRVQVLEETATLPAVTAGLQFKHNCSIRDINKAVWGGLTRRGLRKSNGVDYTLTATKLFWIKPGPPVVVTLGLRNSKAYHIGLAGFGNQCQTTMEFSVGTMLAEGVAVGYEFRQKISDFNESNDLGLLGNEDHWHAFRCRLKLGQHATLGAGVAMLGSTGNTRSDLAFGLNFQWNF